MPGILTRRSFLEIVGQAGGGAAVYSAMRALELQAAVNPPPFAPVGRAPHGTKVVVLGAGIAGLTAAYELQKLGYECEVLEARTRVGGRAFTAKRGVVSEEVGPTAGQTCDFDEGHYYNCGPMRIPNTHVTTLEYCRELGVPIEMFTSVNEASFLHQSKAADPATAKMRLRELHADWRGFTSELLAKAISQESLDRPLSADDKERIMNWLRFEGGLDANMHYATTARRGYKIAPGVADVSGVASDPVALAQLLHTTYSGSLTTDILLQTPMFQVVGGTQMLPATLGTRVKNVKLGAEVIAIEQPEGRVRVRYRDASGEHQTEGTFCICTLPLVLLKDMAVDVAPAMRDAIKSVSYATTGKIGLQFKRRFWEEDDGIYSGITRTDLDITQIVYPSYGYLSKKGVVIGYYQTGPLAAAMGELKPADRLAKALEQGSQIHPQYKKEFETAFSVSWQNVRYSKGGWAQLSEETRKGPIYQALCRPDRAFYLAGDYVTYSTAWMQGAFQSGRAVTQAIHERASKEAGAAHTAASR
jgi:monoamine oxidase